MNCLNLLKLRNKEKINWESIEHSGRVIPPAVKLFFDLYDHKSLYDINEVKYWDRHLNKLSQFCDYIHSSHDILLDKFFDPDQFYDMLEIMLDATDEIDQEVINKGIIPIGVGSSDYLLLVGNQIDNMDYIYYFVRWEDEPLIYVASNIFEFMGDMKVIPREGYIKGGSISDLYRNWNEDFWRIRGEEENT
jgi:hypothetical protein